MEQAFNELPHQLDAEKSVIGALLKSPEAVMLAQETLTEDDFFDPGLRELFAACMYLAALSRPVDIVTLSQEMDRRGRLEAIGGTAYLVELVRGVPAASNVGAYISIVDEKSTLRKLIAAAQSISKSCYAGEMETADILAQSEKLIYDITMRKGGEQLTPIQPLLVKTFEFIERLVNNHGRIEGVPSGYKALDDMTTGFHPGELVLIAARPSMGKTSFGMNIIANSAIREKKKAAVFSLEMPAEQLVLRMLCTEARVDMQRVRKGRIDDDEWFKLSAAMTNIAGAAIFIDATAGMTVPQMRSKARRLQMEHGLDVIMIDYLQLMTGTGKFGSRQEEIAGISRQLKALATELGVPVIALSQLSRAPTGRSNHRPVLSDIRDSGAIEQDADVVMFIHREEYYDPKPENKDKAEIIISKQRNGALGTVELGWKGEFTRFFDLTPEGKEVSAD
ncbi:MAG: replicative DNA helicase [Clostridiales bacterium]|nr:replicative DNA helicase [Clostridiales bacterium]